jgi:Bor protein
MLKCKTTMFSKIKPQNKVFICLISSSLLLSSCYSYRIATHAQGGTEPIKVIGKSYFWGMLQNPPLISTPVCDSLGARGMSGIRIKKNFGRSLVTAFTLGFYSAVELEYQCGKPTPKTINPL